MGRRETPALEDPIATLWIEVAILTGSGYRSDVTLVGSEGRDGRLPHLIELDIWRSFAILSTAMEFAFLRRREKTARTRIQG
jgi:hypothetical protein